MFDEEALRDKILNSVPPSSISEVQSQPDSTTTATERSENVEPLVGTTPAPDEQETPKLALSGESAEIGGDS